MLTAVDPSNSGKYRCEVSADAPSFHTNIVTGDLEVVGKCFPFLYYIHIPTVRFGSTADVSNKKKRIHSIFFNK